MKRFLALFATIITIVAPITADAANPPSNKTSAEANCVWGTKPGVANLASYVTIYSSAGEWRLANPPTGECNMAIAYLPTLRGIGSSSLVAYSSNSWSPDRKSAICANGDDPVCDASKWSIIWNQSAFYKCKSAADLNCVQDFAITDPNGMQITPTYVKSFPDDTVRPAFNGSVIKYPAGGNPSIWSFNTPSGEVKVLINGWFEMAWDSQGGKWTERPGNSFQLFILPIKETPIPQDIVATPCFGLDKTTCLKLEPSLPAGYTFKVSLNLSDNATMFLNGRLDKPLAYTETIPGGHRFTIEAATSPALSVAQWIPKSAIPSSVIDSVALKTTGTWYRDTLNWSNSEFNMSGGVEGGVDLFDAMLPYIGDKASFVQYVWGLTNNPSSDRYDQKCRDQSRGEILGIVSTNATAYRGDPPTYNKSTLALEYEVSAPHFLPDGKTPAVGRYSINMNAKFLQCIIGVAQVPSSVTVGLSYGSGESNITTLLVKQDKDWLRVALDNFHFSSPKISIKFNVPASAPETSSTQAPAPTPSASAVPQSQNPQPPSTTTPNKVTAPKLKTISCVRGKTIKKITAANPKCPSGYTLKK